MIIDIKGGAGILKILKGRGWTLFNQQAGRYGTPELWKHPTKTLYFRTRDRVFGTKLAYDKLFSKTIFKMPSYTSYKMKFDTDSNLIIIDDFVAVSIG
jgi:hypothetical protein